jgi:prevent-host-death family protein
VATIQQKELRNASGEILRRAEAGETITVTVSGRPVAQIGPIARRSWVPSDQLAPIWRTPAPVGLQDDLAGFDVELDDPYAR